MPDSWLQTLMGFLFVVVGVNIVLAILFGVVYSKLVSEDVRAKNAWQQVSSLFRDRLRVLATLLALFENHAPAETKTLREVWDIVDVIAKIDSSSDIIHEQRKFS